MDRRKVIITDEAAIENRIKADNESRNQPL